MKYFRFLVALAFIASCAVLFNTEPSVAYAATDLEYTTPQNATTLSAAADFVSEHWELFGLLVSAIIAIASEAIGLSKAKANTISEVVLNLLKPKGAKPFT